MRATWLVVLVLLIAVAPEAVVGACQAAVEAAVQAIGSLLAGDVAASAVGVLLGGAL